MSAIRSTWTGAALALLAVATLGCSDDSGAGPGSGPVPLGLVLQGGASPLSLGDSARVTARLRMSDGSVEPAGAVTWASRDPSTARVAADGLVTSVEIGEAWVVASTVDFADSVMVDVRADVGRGARVRLDGGGSTRVLRLGDGLAEFTDFLGGDDGDNQVVIAIADAASALLVLATPGRFPEGTSHLAPWPDSYLDSTAAALPSPLAFLGMEEAGGDVVVVAIRTARLEVSYRDAPAGPSPVAGELRLRLVGEGDGYTVDPSTSRRTPDGRSWEVVADVRTPYHHRPRGTSSGTAVGGSASVTWTRGTASWNAWGDDAHLFVRDHEGTLFLLASRPVVDGRVEGTSILGGPPADTVGSAEVRHYDQIHPGGSFHGVAATGTFEVSHYRPPSSDRYGEVAGRLQGRFLSPPDAEGAMDVELEFAAPVMDAGPAAASGPQGVRPPTGPVLDLLRRPRAERR